MSKEELLKYLIAEIDLIMHDKDYRFENANGTWYSRESCRDLTNEEVLEELRAELIQLNNETNREIAELQKQLEEKERLLQYGKTEIKKLGKRITDIVKRDEKLFKSQPAEIVEKIKEQLIKRLNTIAGYGRMTTDELSFFIETEFGSDLDSILKKYGGKDE